MLNHLVHRHALEDTVERLNGSFWNEVTRGFFPQKGYRMRVLLKAYERIEGVGVILAEPSQLG